MALGIFMLVFFAVVGYVGVTYVRLSRRMRTFETTRGRVTARELGEMHDRTTGLFGRGGGYFVKPTYEYEVAGRSYSSDRYGHAQRGLKEEIAREEVDALPDQVDVYYDPEDPAQAYLEKHSPGLGYVLIVVAAFGLLIALLQF